MIRSFIEQTVLAAFNEIAEQLEQYGRRSEAKHIGVTLIDHDSVCLFWGVIAKRT